MLFMRDKNRSILFYERKTHWIFSLKVFIRSNFRYLRIQISLLALFWTLSTIEIVEEVYPKFCSFLRLILLL